jgi:tRNA A-37 threonylcarbamoyl transferase component Bud32
MAADPLIGLMLGDYLVEEVVASGGMGIVYRARHPLLKRAVAVKVLRAKYAEDAEQVQRFLKEAQLLSALQHDGIVDVINFGNLPDGRQYMMMELLSGETLGKVLKREGKLPVARALELADQLLAALAVAHQAGVVHRDLKPSNIFLVPQSNGDERLKLLDFGIAQKLAPEEKYDPKKKASIVGGTPQYVSPEQAEGLVATPSSDLYAVGGVLFHMLSGRVAFMGDEAGLLLRAHATVPAPTLISVMPDVAPELNALVAQLLEKKPARRPQSAELVRREVARIRENLPAAPVAPPPIGNSRRALFGFVGLVAAGGLASFVALQFFEEPAAPPQPQLQPAPVATRPVVPAPSEVKKAEAPPALDEAAYKKAMAEALEREAAMEAQHRDRELVMGMRKITEEGMPVGHEKEMVEKTLAPALAVQIEAERLANERRKTSGPVDRDAERLSVLRASCQSAQWKRAASAKIDRELGIRLGALAEEALPNASERMARLKLDADRLTKAVNRAKTLDQCIDALTDVDRWVTLNLAR